MKKRLLTLFLVLAMLCAMSIGASAVAVGGRTENPSPGNTTLPTRATLDRTKLDAQATTWSGAGDSSILYTRLTFDYIDYNEEYISVRVSGKAAAGCYPDDISIAHGSISAQSSHTVAGGANGIWTYTLYA